MTGKVVGQLQLGNLPNVWHSLDTLEERDRSVRHSLDHGHGLHGSEI